MSADASPPSPGTSVAASTQSLLEDLPHQPPWGPARHGGPLTDQSRVSVNDLRSPCLCPPHGATGVL